MLGCVQIPVPEHHLRLRGLRPHRHRRPHHLDRAGQQLFVQGLEHE